MAATACGRPPGDAFDGAGVRGVALRNTIRLAGNTAHAPLGSEACP